MELNNPILVTRKQAADILNVSIRTVDYLLEAGKLESVFIGASRRIALDAVKALAANGTK